MERFSLEFFSKSSPWRNAYSNPNINAYSNPKINAFSRHCL